MDLNHSRKLRQHYEQKGIAFQILRQDKGLVSQEKSLKVEVDAFIFTENRLSRRRP